MDLVERDLELDLLVDHLRGVGRRGGHVVLLGGEAGIGKTSLLRALAQRREGATLWWGACDALQTPHPLAPLHDIARSSAVSFQPLLGVAGERALLFETVLVELQHSRTATLVVVEDAHWADDATSDLLKFLGRRIDRLPCLLVISFRNDEIGSTHPLRLLLGDLPHRTVTRLDLSPLSPQAVDLLARRAFQSPDGVHAATRGNPFFVTELLRHGGQSVPRAVQDLVLARFAALGADAQRILRLASIVPTRIERWLVDHLLGPSPVPIDACLNSGLLMTVAPAALGFRHEIARVAIESSLSEPVARGLHAAVLAALVGRPGAAVPLARMVHHASLADDHAAVLKYAPGAAEEAEQRGASREATRHYGAALRHLPLSGVAEDPARTARWLEAYARGSERSEQLDEYIAGRLRLADLHHRAGNAEAEGHNLSKLAMAYAMALRFEEAIATNQRAMELLDTPTPGTALASAFRAQAHLHLLEGDAAASQSWSLRALALASHLGDRRTELIARGTHGHALLFSDFDAGRAEVKQCIEQALAEGFGFVAASVYSSIGPTLCELFQLPAAQQVLQEALVLAEQPAYDMFRGRYRAWLSLCQLWLGQWDAAEASAQDALRSPGWHHQRLVALVALGRVRARRGDAGAAEPLDEALALVRSGGALRHVALVRAGRCEAAWLRGDLPAVAEEAGAASALAVESRHGWLAGELACWLRRAGVAAEMPRPCATPYALQLQGRWTEAAAAWSALGCPYEEALALAEGDGAAPVQALQGLVQMGARPAAEALQARLRQAGRRGLPRLPRALTYANPFRLTRREIEVLELLCAGLTNTAIAQRLVRSVRTVDHHVAAVCAKLGVNSRSAAVLAARQAGIAFNSTPIEVGAAAETRLAALRSV